MEYGIIILSVLLFITIFATIILAILNNIKGNKLKQLSVQLKKLSNTYNFDQDVQFLHYLMADKIHHYKLFVIKPMYSLNDRKLIKDEELNGIIEELVLDIINSLSQEYNETLYKYFTKESLAEYITETVFTELTSEVVSTNNKRIRQINVKES